MKEYLKSWCAMVHNHLRGTYPDFLVEAWTDKVECARAISRGGHTSYDLAMAAGYAGETDVTTWAGDIIEQNHPYVAARIVLSDFYHQSEDELAAAAPEELMEVGASILTKAGYVAHQLAGEDTEAREKWLAELAAFGKLLRGGEDPGDEGVS